MVEDDPGIAALLRRSLEREGHAVDIASSGEDAIWLGTENEHDVIILDVVIPGPDGIEVTRTLRQRGRWAPILLLTARRSVEDRVAGLDAGADDYLPKPFAMAELHARVRALARRHVRERPAVLEVGDIRLDPATREVERAGQQVDLTPKEFSLLELFLQHPGEVLSRDRILEYGWDFAQRGRSNVVDVYVRYLREKVDRPFGRESIETVRGAGYRFDPDQ